MSKSITKYLLKIELNLKKLKINIEKLIEYDY